MIVRTLASLFAHWTTSVSGHKSANHRLYSKMLWFVINYYYYARLNCVYLFWASNSSLWRLITPVFLEIISNVLLFVCFNASKKLNHLQYVKL